MPERAEIEAVARALIPYVLEHTHEAAEKAIEALDAERARVWRETGYDANADIRVDAILDRVRDARGDDEGARAMEIAGDIARDHARRFPDGEPSCSSCGVRLDQDNAAEDATCCDYCVAKAARSPQAEDHENCPDCWGGRPKWAGTMPAPPCPTCGGTGKIPWSPQREDHEVGIEAARQVLHGYVWHERLSDVTRATVAAYLSRVSPSRDGTVAVEDMVAAARALRWNVADPYGDDTNIIVEGASWRELQRALAEFGPARAGESDEGDR